MHTWKLATLVMVSVLIANAQTINVRGKVTNQAGKPIASAVVTLVKQGLKDTTGTDGAYAITKNNAAVLPLLTPETEDISMSKGMLEFSLTKDRKSVV